MTVKERYDRWISLIEEYAKDPHMSYNDIAMEIARETTYDQRDLNTIMKFLADTTLLDYIKTRKMMAAYQWLANAEVSDSIDYAVAISGKGTHSYFDTAFKSMFKTQPSKILGTKDFSMLKPPLIWKTLSCYTGKNTNIVDTATRKETIAQAKEQPAILPKKTHTSESLIYGVSTEQYEKITVASDLAAMYGMDLAMGNYAFIFSEKNKVSLEESFRYVYETIEFFSEMDASLGRTYHCDHDTVRRSTTDRLIKFLFFKCHLSVSLAYDFIDRINLPKQALLKLSPIVIHLYAHTCDSKFDYFLKAIDYFTEHADDNYDYENLNTYIDDVSRGLPIEIAFEAIIPAGNFEDIVDDIILSPEDEYDEYDTIERMADEISSWNDICIEPETDPDNITLI